MSFAGLAFLAGVLSTLSPCVLPILPIVVAAAVSKHRFGPAALAAGLSVSFVVVGLFIATVGFAIGLDEGLFRRVAAALLIAIGLVLLVPRLEMRLALVAGPASNWAGQRLHGSAADGWPGQFGVGLLLGMVWSPCVGPTLGAASLMAAQGHDLGQVALVMALFGLGAALPLLLLGLFSREALMAWRGRLISAGKSARMALGAVLVVSGIAIFSGLDRVLQTALINLSPAWLADLSTRF